ncbi:RM48 protein, partial [Polypterus senegalus]
VFSVVQNHDRNYRSKPTHGIGRYKYLLPKEVPKKKKEKLQMKEIKAGTDVEYAVLNVCVSGHDMTLVEHFSQYIHNLCNRLKIKVDESYALPTKCTEVMLMQDQGTKMYTDAILNTHMRVVQLGALSSTLAPIFIEILQMNQPEGVQFSIKEILDSTMVWMVGVVLKEQYVKSLERMMIMKLEIEGVMMNVVSAYFPQIWCAMDEKNDFWCELDEVVESVPKGRRVVIGADF